MEYRTVAQIEDPSVARVLIAALKAHGFHPLEGPEHGLPGLAGVYGPKGLNPAKAIAEIKKMMVERKAA